MQVSEATIIKDVRVAMDENTSVAPFTDSDGNTFDPDTLEMEEIIKSKIADGVNAVRSVAPLSKLEPASIKSGEGWPVTWIDGEKMIGEVPLPDDYLRMVMFKMSDWAHAATTPIAADSALYHQQFSKWKGVRGNPSRPNIAIATDTATGKNVLQFFSCDSTEATAELAYIKRCDGPSNQIEIDSAESKEIGSPTRPSLHMYEIEKAIYRAVVLKIAALVAAAYANGDMMNLMNTLAQEVI